MMMDFNGFTGNNEMFHKPIAKGCFQEIAFIPLMWNCLPTNEIANVDIGREFNELALLGMSIMAAL